jgi:small GTP-binding protein
MSDLNEFDFIFKLILIGDSGVGKSSLALRFAFDDFNMNGKATIGVDFMSRVIVHDNNRIRAMLWDTGGQERYRGLLESYYRGAVGAILAFDITNRGSFDRVEHWLDEIRRHGDSKMKVVLVGNKRDRRHERRVTTAEATALATKLGIAYIEASALESINVDQAFESLIITIFNDLPKNTDYLPKKTAISESTPIKLEQQQQQQQQQQNQCCYSL